MIIRKQQGLTLVELLISIALALVVVGAIIAMFVSTVVSNSERLAMTRLDQDTRAIMNLVTGDLRRAGHWGAYPELISISSNNSLTRGSLSDTTWNLPGPTTMSIPLQTAINGKTLRLARCRDGDPSADPPIPSDGDCLDPKPDDTRYQAIINGVAELSLTLPNFDETGNFEIPTSTSIPANGWMVLNPFSVIANNDTDEDGVFTCIVFRYDLAGDGVVGGEDQIAFRHNSGDSTIEVRSNAANATVCGDDDTAWSALNDNAVIKITGFTFTDRSPALLGAGAFGLKVREYHITIEGELANDDTVTRIIEETVRVRNDDMT